MKIYIPMYPIGLSGLPYDHFGIGKTSVVENIESNIKIDTEINNLLMEKQIGKTSVNQKEKTMGTSKQAIIDELHDTINKQRNELNNQHSQISSLKTKLGTSEGLVKLHQDRINQLIKDHGNDDARYEGEIEGLKSALKILSVR